MLVARLTYVKTSLAGTGLDVWNPGLLVAGCQPLGPGPGPRSRVRGPSPGFGAPVRGEPQSGACPGPPVRGPGPGLGARSGPRYGARFPFVPDPPKAKSPKIRLSS